MKPALVDVVQVSKHWMDGNHSTTVLNAVSCRIYAGEKVALRGVSGSGKSTLLNIIGTLDTQFTGDVFFEGQNISPLSRSSLANIRNKDMGFVFQSHNLLPHLTVLDNVLLPAWLGNTPPDAAHAQHLLNSVGLEKKIRQRPHALSGGERQRVAIARALYNKPKLVLCDEPTGHLDPQTAQHVLALFDELCKNHGVTWLIATHDEAVAQWTHRSLLLHEGHLSP
jgi:ABC-type lipoprotein export system ATPase subunit